MLRIGNLHILFRWIVKKSPNGSVCDLAYQAAGLKFPGNVLGWTVWRKNLRCTIWEYAHVEMVGISLPYHCVLAYGLQLTGEDFYNEHSFFSSNNLITSDLINGDMLSDLEVYYQLIGDYDSTGWRDLLSCREIKEWELQERLVKFPPEIFLQLVFRRKIRIDIIILLRKSRSSIF